MSFENSTSAISVQNLSKSYRIAHNAKADSLGELVTQRFRKPLQRTSHETYWALKDVSFEVAPGEVVGVIGRNGAGKSTLLKLLSQITAPTTGEIQLRGRVGSLLEVGTGFHPELTGSENIFLNGAILGMKRREIQAQFDEIVEFAGVERFLDTPVKRYSSGMYIRLAFAVAAHLNPEILIVDEVLAVGDADFQKKCLGKMNQVAAQQGRTVVFVSHNMAAVMNLCSHCLFLRNGQTVTYGLTPEVVARYVQAADEHIGQDLAARTDRTGNGDVRCVALKLRDQDGNEIQRVRPNQPFMWELVYEANRPLTTLLTSVDVETPEGSRLTSLYSQYRNQTFQIAQGKGSLYCRVEGLNLLPGTYSLNTMLGYGTGLYDFVESAAVLEIEDTDVYQSGKIPKKAHGLMLMDFSWSPA